jgi:hypothetical protein
VTLDDINPSLPRPVSTPAPSRTPVTVPVTMQGQLVRRNEGVVVSISKEAQRLRGTR